MIETLTFRLAQGTDESEFLLADHAVQTEFIPNLPGFLRRTTSRNHDEEWLVVTLWQSENQAEACESMASTSEVYQRFMQISRRHLFGYEEVLDARLSTRIPRGGRLSQMLSRAASRSCRCSCIVVGPFHRDFPVSSRCRHSLVTRCR